MKKRLLFITTVFPRFEGDHLGIFTYRILKSLAEYLEHVVVFCPTDVKAIESFLGKKESERKNIQHEMFSKKMEVYRPLYRLSKFFSPLWGVMWLILNRRKFSFDFVSAQFVTSSGVIGLIISKIFMKPFIIQVDGMDFWMPEKKGISRNLFFVPRYFVMRYADVIVVEGRDTQRAISRLKIKNERIKWIPTGIDLRDFRTDVADILVPGINKEDIVLTQIGNLIQLKGQRYLIEAVSKIVKDFKNLKLVFVGEGPEKNHYIKLCKEKGVDALFLGLVPPERIPSILKRTDIYLHLSLVEGMSNVILEAMSMGKPVIASRVGGIDDVIEDGINGFLVLPGDIKSTVDRLRYLMLNRGMARKIGIAARKTIEENFDLQALVKQYARLIENIGST